MSIIISRHHTGATWSSAMSISISHRHWSSTDQITLAEIRVMTDESLGARIRKRIEELDARVDRALSEPRGDWLNKDHTS